MGKRGCTMEGKGWARSVLGAATAVLFILVSGSAVAGNSAGIADEAVTVFAAASTTDAVMEIGELFSSRGLGRMTASFASSSTLAKQIENGAPADVYISANKKWMDYLQAGDRIDPASRFDLLSNRIVLIVPGESPLTAVEVVPHFPLAELLGEGRLAMGDPDHVPAGIYGKQALEDLKAWSSVQDRIAPMKDVRTALVMVECGEVPLGLVYATDAAISKKVRVVGQFPPGSHPAIVYPVALVAGRQTAAAQRFGEFLRSPAAKAVFQKYGFIVN
jgi:molybdate transport system substrate-binding protein